MFSDITLKSTNLLNRRMKELRKWILIITLQNMGESNIEELVKMSLLRASFGELLSKEIQVEISSFDAFLTGIFSLMDALMNIPIENVLGELPVSKDVKDALLGNENILSDLLKLIREYENGNWEEANKLIEKFGLDEQFVSDCYLEAIQKTQNIESV